jgi:peptidoglycan/xylan/chitin deacetylase (PgdA/CDA1 family)
MVTTRSVAKDIAYRAGIMDAYHELRNADSLTVVMFHRVLPADELARTDADPAYTVTPQFLEDCVEFLQRNYNVISLEDVLGALADAKRLPRHAALITFDDGWHDNLQYAVPTLSGTPWTIFVTAEAMCEPECWWQEVLLWAIRSHAASIEELWSRAEGVMSELPRLMPDSTYALLQKYAGLKPQHRSALLSPYRAALVLPASGQMMLSPDDFAALRKSGASIAAHASSHVPLTLLTQDSLERDLNRSRDLMTEWMGGAILPAMSMPHGRYNEAVLAAAKRSGYRLLFTSDPHLNPRSVSTVVGRIAIDMKDLADSRGRLDRGHMAAWLFRRERH